MMRSKRKNTIIYSIICAFMAVCVFVTTITFAIYSSKKSVDIGLGSGNINYSLNQTSIENSVSVFKNPGDTFDNYIEITNTGDTPFYYSLGFSLTRENELSEGQLGIENEIFVFVDDVYAGTLSEYTRAENPESYAVTLPLAKGNTIKHRVKLEYHLDSGIYSNNNFSLSLVVKSASTLNEDDNYIFIDNFKNLKTFSRNNLYEGKTFVLNRDITLDSNLIFYKNCSFYLNGHSIYLSDGTNNYTMTFKGNGVNRIFTRDNLGSIDSEDATTQKVIVDCSDGIVVDDTDEIYAYSEVTENGRSAASLNTLRKDYLESFNKLVINGITKTEFDVVKGYHIYTKSNLLSLATTNSTASSLSFTKDSDTGTISMTPIRANYTIDEQISIGVNDVSHTITDYLYANVRIWGTNTADAIEGFLKNNVLFLKEVSDITASTVFLINRDIYLPTYFREYDCKIIWSSTNPEVLSSSGKVTRPYFSKDEDLVLTARVICNGSDYVFNYNIHVNKKTSEDILEEVMMRIESELSFTAVGEVIEPLYTKEDFADLGVTNLSYTLDDEAYPYLELSSVNDGGVTKSSLTLTASTENNLAYLGVSITLNDGITTENYERSAKVKIELNQSTSLFDAMFRNLMSYVGLIPNNTIDNFELPSIYVDTQNTYEYYLYENYAAYGYSGYQNPSDFSDYINTTSDHKSIVITQHRLPNKNTTINVLVKMTSGTNSNYKIFSFNVGGILTYGANEEIEDPALYVYLLSLADQNHDGILTIDEVNNSHITTMTKKDASITSLKGLEYFKELEYIDFSNNSIYDLSPLQNLNSLKTIKLSNNEIQNIDALLNLTNVTTLDLSNNIINSIDALKYMTNLKSLKVNGNANLSDISILSNFNNISELFVYDTMIVSQSGSPSNYNFNYYTIVNLYLNCSASKNYKLMGSNISWPTSNLSDEKKMNEILNSLSTLYEINNVIYLPQVIEYQGASYPINWSCSNPSIITIDEATHRAYVNQPIVDLNVKLWAGISYGAYNMYRPMSIVSRSSNTELILIKEDGTILTGAEVVEAIPDDYLRSKLYNLYGVGDTTSTTIDIPSLINTVSDTSLDLSSLGIKDITGLGLFNSLITSLQINNSDIDDYSELSKLSNLISLRINYGSINVNDLIDSNSPFNYMLSLYGCKFVDENGDEMDSNDVKAGLYRIFKKVLEDYSTNPTIYYDSNSTVWNPYYEPIIKVLYQFPGIVELNYDETYSLGTSDLRIDMYGVDTIAFNSSNKGCYYNDGTLTSIGDKLGIEFSTKTTGSISVSNGIIRYNSFVGSDTITYVTRTISVYYYPNAGSTTDATTLCSGNNRTMVVKKDIDDMYIEMPDGSIVLLSSITNDASFKNYIYNIYNKVNVTSDNHPLVTQNNINSLTSIEFNGHNGSSLAGLSIFSSSNSLTSVKFSNITKKGYVDGNDYSDYFSLFNSTNFPKITVLSFEQCYIDLADFASFTNLVTLNCNCCVYVNLSTTSFAAWTKLVTLNLISCGISSFEALSSINSKALRNLKIYDNPAITYTPTKTSEIIRNLLIKVYGSEANASSATDYEFYVMNQNQRFAFADVVNLDVNYLYDIDGVEILDSETNTTQDTAEPGRILSTNWPYATENYEGANYVTDGDLIYCPKYYYYRGVAYTISWTNSSSSILVSNGIVNRVINGQTISCNVYKITAINVYSYCYLAANVTSNKISVTLAYSFIVSPKAGAVIGASDVDEYIPSGVSGLSENVLDIRTFMNGDVLEDECFAIFTFKRSMDANLPAAYKKYGLLSKSFMKGRYSGVDFAIDDYSASSNKSNNNLFVHSIKGINSFVCAKTLRFRGAPIESIAAIENLCAQKMIIESPNFKTYYYEEDGEKYSYFTNIDGVAHTTGKDTRGYYGINELHLSNIDVDSLWPIAFKTETAYRNYQTTGVINEDDLTEYIKTTKNLYVYNSTVEAQSNYGTSRNLKPISSVDGFLEMVEVFRYMIEQDTTNSTYNFCFTGYTNTSTTNVFTSIKKKSITKSNHSDLDKVIALMKYVPDYSTITFAKGSTLPSSATVDGLTINLYYPVINCTKYNNSNTYSGFRSYINISKNGSIDKFDNNGLTTDLTILVSPFDSTEPNSSDDKLYSYYFYREFIIPVGDVESKIQLTEQEATIDYAHYGLSNPVTVDSDGNYWADASTLIPDNSLRFLLIKTFDTSNNNNIELSERTTYKNITPNLTNSSIVSLKGLDLFQNCNGFDLRYNNIKTIPELYVTQETKNKGRWISFDFANNLELSDIKNLIFDGDGSGTNFVALSTVLKTLNLNSCDSVPNSQRYYLTIVDPSSVDSGTLRFVDNYPSLTTLNLPNRLFEDYEFIKYLPSKVTTFTTKYRVVPDDYQEYRDAFILSSAYSSSKNFITTRLDDLIYFEDSYEVDQLSNLPSEFEFCGDTYKVRYSTSETNLNLTYDSVSQITTITPNEDCNAKPKLRVSIYYEDRITGSWINSYQQDKTINVTSSVNSDIDVIEQLVDAEIQITDGGEYVDLSSLVVDPSLRYDIIRTYDNDYDGKISYSNLGSKSSLQFGSRYRITSLEGLSSIYDETNISKITSLELTYMQVNDLSELKNFTAVQTLKLTNFQYTIIDFSFIECLPNLKSIDFTNSRYFSLDGLENVQSGSFAISGVTGNAGENNNPINASNINKTEVGTLITEGLSNNHELLTNLEQYAGFLFSMVKYDDEVLNYLGESYEITWTDLCIGDDSIMENGERKVTYKLATLVLEGYMFQKLYKAPVE